jgi:hypothetical protein
VFTYIVFGVLAIPLFLMARSYCSGRALRYRPGFQARHQIPWSYKVKNFRVQNPAGRHHDHGGVLTFALLQNQLRAEGLYDMGVAA